MQQEEVVMSRWSKRLWSLWPSDLCASLIWSKPAVWTTRTRCPLTSTETMATGYGRLPRGEEQLILEFVSTTLMNSLCVWWWENSQDKINRESFGNISTLVCVCLWQRYRITKGEKLKHFQFPFYVTSVLFSFWQFCVWCGVYLLYQRWEVAGRWRDSGLH